MMNDREEVFAGFTRADGQATKGEDELRAEAQAREAEERKLAEERAMMEKIAAE